MGTLTKPQPLDSLATWLGWLTTQTAKQQPVIEGLIGSGMTAIYGHPGAGKSWLTCQIVEAVSSDKGSLWGLVIPQTEMRVAIVITDDDGVGEYGQRLEQIGTDTSKVHLAEAPPSLSDGSQWTTLATKLSELRPDLLVVDNLFGLGGGDFTNTKDAQAIIAKLKQLKQASGARLIAVAHPKKANPFESEPSVFGSQLFTAAFRQFVYVKKVGQRNKLKVTGNQIRDIEYQLLDKDLQTGKLIPSNKEGQLLEKEQSQQQRPEQLQEMAEAVLQYQTTLEDSKRRYAEQFGTTEGTAKGRITRLRNNGWLESETRQPLRPGPKLLEARRQTLQTSG